LTGRLHHRGGIVFFLGSLAVLILLMRMLRQPELQPPRELSLWVRSGQHPE